jgi:hypothetical protein
MCKIVYLVADRPLPEVTSECCDVPVLGREPLPNYAVRAFDGPERERVCAIAGGDFAYVAQSWEGCGCGFGYEGSGEFEASLEGAPADVRATCRKRREAGIASVAALSAYLRQAVHKGLVTVYVAYAGGEGRRPLSSERRVTPGHFGGDAFWFHEDQLYDVVEDEGTT